MGKSAEPVGSHLKLTFYRNKKSGKIILLTVGTRKIKYLEINLSKEVKELYSENYDTDERN